MGEQHTTPEPMSSTNQTRDEPFPANREQSRTAGGAGRVAPKEPTPAPGTSEQAPAVDEAVPAAAHPAPGGSPTGAAQAPGAQPLAQGKDAGTGPGTQALVSRPGGPDGEVAPR